MDCAGAGSIGGYTLPHVLIIDDEPDGSDALAACLGRAGYSARCARSGREALSALIDRLPDAILLDVRMPDMDGVEVLEVIRSYVRWAGVPIAMLTAYAEDPRLRHLAQLGVTRVFLKSKASLDELLEWVSEQAGRATPPSGLNPPPAPQAGV